MSGLWHRIRGGVKIPVSGRSLVIAAPALWLGVFFLVPFLFVLKISFSSSVVGIPPYAPVFTWTDGVLNITLNFGNYAYLFGDSLYLLAYLSSVEIAAVTTFFCLILGYPMAYAIASARQPWRNIFLMLVIMPFWTSFLIRVYAWIGILKDNGLLNNLLLALHLIDEPIVMLHTDFSVYVGMVYAYLPFMVLPLYSTLEKLDGSLLEAANDLGARPLRAFWSVTLPLSMPGILAGSLLVFIPAVGDYLTPTLLGGADTLMIGRVLWDEFFGNRDWPVAATVAVAMILLLLVPMMVLQRAQASDGAKS